MDDRDTFLDTGAEVERDVAEYTEPIEYAEPGEDGDDSLAD